MNGKSVLFMIITSVISLVIILASYYGYTRYLKLRFDNKTMDYAKDYLKLERANTKKKIVVSMYASTYSSVKTMINSINSLLDQTVKPDQIIVSTPPDSTFELDSFLTSQNIIIIYKMAKDYGEIGSLVSPLLLEKDGEVIIILASERVIYGVEFIEQMVDTSVKNPDCVIYNHGFNAKQFVNNNVKNESETDIIDSDYGVLVKPKFFASNIIDEDRFKSLEILLSVYIRDKVCMKSTNYSELFKSAVGKNNDELKKEIIINSIYFPSF